MTRGIAIGILVSFVSVSIAIIAARPEWVSDGGNAFLKNFVNHEFISVLGITLAVTLASAAQVHLKFNEIEEKYKVRNALEKTRAELRGSTFWLIWLFAVGVVLVTIKPVAACNASFEAFFNLAALLVLLWHVLLLVSLTDLVFAIEPEFVDEEATPASRPNASVGSQLQSDTESKKQ